MSSLLGRKFDVPETISKVYLNAGLDHNLIERILTTLTNNDDQRYVICKTKTDEGLESQWEISRSGNQ